MILAQNGNKIPVEEIYNAHLWCLSSLRSVLGPEKAKSFMDSLHPSEVISLWLYLLDEALDADES